MDIPRDEHPTDAGPRDGGTRGAGQVGAGSDAGRPPEPPSEQPDGSSHGPAYGLPGLVAALRDNARTLAAAQAEQLRLVDRLALASAADARQVLAAGRRVAAQPEDDDLARSAATSEVMSALGMAEGPAGRLVDLAGRLSRVLPEALEALESGRVDLSRLRTLSEATEVLDNVTAREVARRLLARAGEAPWSGPSPRAWRGRVDRAVVAADADAARERRQRALRDRLVRSWPNGDGTGELCIKAADADVVMAESVITDLARAWPTTGPDGEPLTMDQRRVDALMDVFRRIRDGAALPKVGVARERELGVVLHSDTLFGDGPAAGAPGELRGLGRPAVVDPVSVRGMARVELEGGARVRALVTNAFGTVIRALRLPETPGGGWTRESMVRAARAAWVDSSALRTTSYTPTRTIAEHVRAVHPRCVSYDCGRSARRCDLDHDEPWPRGPTDAWSLVPRCRRHHEHKTRGLVSTTLYPEGSLDTLMLSGVVVRTRPEPLPGFGLGEGYEPARAW